MRALAVAALMGATGVALGGEPVVFRLDTKTAFQTWEGWSCTPNPAGFERAFAAWLRHPTPGTYDRVGMSRDLPSKLIARMHDALVEELGITRMRIEVGPQVEMANDNADPFRTDVAAYRFLWQDDQIERHVLPIRRRIEKRGEKATLYVTYDLRSSRTPPFLLEPEEYAEMAVTFLAHAKERYGIEPDYWSVLERSRRRRHRLHVAGGLRHGHALGSAHLRPEPRPRDPTPRRGRELRAEAPLDDPLRRLQESRGAADPRPA